jgi:acetyl esterase/lipase
MPTLRALLLALFALLAVSAPASAQVTIFSPFNLPGTVDTNVAKLGDNIAYADGQRYKLDVYTPQNPIAGGAPVVMFLYGGAWKAGDKFEYEFVGRALASQGFVTVIPDYRLYPEVTYPAFLEDAAKALKWIEDNIAEYHGDPQRVFLAGHSAGAYNAVMLALDQSFSREYGVTIPINGVAGISGPYDFYPFEYDEVRNTFGGAANPEGTQPVNLVTPEAPPMLLLSGTTDPIVRVQNSEHLAAALKKQGVWVTEKYYDGFGHMEPVIAMGALWRWRMPVLADIVEFFSRFGAFPSGTPRPHFVPEPPVAEKDRIQDVIAALDGLFTPVDGGAR